MKRRHIVLLCDHKWRDLPGLALVKNKLQALAPGKASVAIISRNSVFEYLESHDADMVAIASSNAPWMKHTEKLHEMGIQVAILPTEGRPNFGSMMEWVLSCHEGEPADSVAIWGPGVESVYNSLKKPNAQSWTVTGTPRFDFYTGPLRNILMSGEHLRARLGIPGHATIVSVSSVYPHAKFKGNEQWQVDDWTRMGFDKIGLRAPDDFYGKISSEFQARQDLAETVKNLSCVFPSVYFVVKCHPFEAVDWWESHAANLGTNVRFVKDVYIGDLLNSASAHLHRGCTTGSEAWLLGVPTVELGFIEDFLETKLSGRGSTAGPIEEAAKVETVAMSYEDLVNILQKSLFGQPTESPVTPERDRFLKRWYGFTDGQSSQRVASFLLDLQNRSVYRGHRFDRAKRAQAALDRLASRIKDGLKAVLNPARSKSLVPAATPGPNRLWDKEVSMLDVRRMELAVQRLGERATSGK